MVLQGREEAPPSSSALSASKGNPLEAHLVAHLAAAVRSSVAAGRSSGQHGSGASIGIITPYRYQVQLIKEQLQRLLPAAHEQVGHRRRLPHSRQHQFRVYRQALLCDHVCTGRGGPILTPTPRAARRWRSSRWTASRAGRRT